jgi:hypothetical protein
MAYFKAVRNADWDLRCAALPEIAAVFYAYKRPKYMQLVAESITVAKRLPPEVLQHFCMGECTVNLTGTLGKSQALDEGHESVSVNRALKQYCGRASLHRVQMLLGFMYSLFTTMGAAYDYTMRHRKQRSYLKKSVENTVVARALQCFEPLMDRWTQAEELYGAATWSAPASRWSASRARASCRPDEMCDMLWHACAWPATAHLLLPPCCCHLTQLPTGGAGLWAACAWSSTSSSTSSSLPSSSQQCSAAPSPSSRTKAAVRTVSLIKQSGDVFKRMFTKTWSMPPRA